MPQLPSTVARPGEARAAGPAAPDDLASVLAGLDDAALTALLTARPDLATPAPGTLERLAVRAATTASVARAVDRLDAGALAVLAAAVRCGAPAPVSLAALRAAARGPAGAVSAAVGRLRAVLLAWGPDEALEFPAALADLADHVAGLGPPAARAFARYEEEKLRAVARAAGVPAGGERRELVAALTERLATPACLHAALDAAGPSARRLAERLASGAPAVTLSGPASFAPTHRTRGPVERLLAAGVLAVVADTRAVLPREAAVALRAGLPPARLTAPPVDGARRDPAAVARVAAAAASGLVDGVGRLLQTWAAEPPPARRGQLARRDRQRLADRLGLPDALAGTLADLAAAAGLVAVDDADTAVWLPTTAADSWTALPPAARWRRLAASWVDDDGAPAAGARLPTAAQRASAPVRDAVIDTLRQLPAGLAPPTSAVSERVRWLLPRHPAGDLDEQVAQALGEAALLGITGLGALSAAGRAMVDADADAAVELLAATFPEPVDRVVLQADLTAVATGPLRPAVAARLAEIADVDSRGGGTVYRFSAGSVRRALDAGHSAAELHALLGEVAATPVPQALTYLVDDEARRRERVRVEPAGAVVHTLDAASLAELLADPRCASLELRPIDPTAAASPLAADAVTAVLRAAGHAPAGPPAPDTAAPDTRTPRRVATRHAPGRPRRAASRDRVAAAVRGLRADRADRSVPLPGLDAIADDVPPTPNLAEALRAAVDAGRPVHLAVVDRDGAARTLTALPVRCAAGRLTVLDQAAGAVRVLPVRRVRDIQPA